MERHISHSLASTSQPCRNLANVNSRRLPAWRFNGTRINSLDDQAEDLVRNMKYQEILKSPDIAELSMLMPQETPPNLFADEPLLPGYDGVEAQDEILSSLASEPYASEYTLDDTNSFRAMDAPPGGIGPSSSGSSRRGYMAATPSITSPPIDPLGIPRELGPEEFALEQYRIEKAVDKAMATHHAIKENAYNIYGVTIRLGELLESLDFQDVAQPAPRLPGTQAKVPGWIRAEDSILEDLEDLNEYHRLLDVQHNENELQAQKERIAQEVEEAIKLLAETNPAAGVAYFDATDDEDIMDDLLGDMLPGTATEALAEDFLDEILPGASSLGLVLDDPDDSDSLEGVVSKASGSSKTKVRSASTESMDEDEENDVEDDDVESLLPVGDEDEEDIDV